MTTVVSERRGRGLSGSGPVRLLRHTNGEALSQNNRAGLWPAMCGRKRIIVVTRSTIAPPCEKAGRRTDSGCTVENAGASLSAQHFRHSRRRFPDVFAWRMLLAPPFALKITTAIYKKYIKAYYLIFKLLFIISVEISRECESFCINNREFRFQIITSFLGCLRLHTTVNLQSITFIFILPDDSAEIIFLSTLKKQSLCAVLSRSCSTSNEQKSTREQSIRLWAAARSTARFLSSVPKSTFRNNCGRLKAAEPKARASSRNASTVIRTISASRSANTISRFAITMPTSRLKRSRMPGWVWANDTRLLWRFSNITRMIFFKRIGVDRSESTWWCYRAVLGHLRAFLKHEYNLHHITLLELEQSFIEQYHVYLKTVCRSKAGSVCRYMDRWNNNVVKISFNNGLMPRNSFALYRYSAPTEPRTFLSEKELRIFQTTRLKSAKHEYHRDLFLFFPVLRESATKTCAI